MVHRKKNGYFKQNDQMPASLVVQVKRRVHFNEVDIMGIAWHGRYPVYFEEGASELGRLCGLSYKNFYETNLRAPIVQLHIDYHLPLRLDEKFTIKASLLWNEGARLNTEYALIKQDGNIATTGYTVQMFIDADSGEPYLNSPIIWEQCRKRWKAGEFSCLQ